MRLWSSLESPAVTDAICEWSKSSGHLDDLSEDTRQRLREDLQEAATKTDEMLLGKHSHEAGNFADMMQLMA